MNFLIRIACIVAVSASLHAAEKKRGGFTGATPSPKSSVTAKKSAAKADEDDEAPSKPTESSDAKSADADTPEKNAEHAPSATIAPETLVEFASQPERIQQLITAALELTKLNLTYTFGSSDPAKGGMDCSGTIYNLLRSQGFKDVPRDSSGQYVWVRKEGEFFAVISKSETSFEFSDLRPGDLMFWSGTYKTGREVPISHVMLYLGTEKKTKKRVMFGASDGRSYNGIQRWGVSVFDFKMPRVDPSNPEKARVDFVGYGRIPGLWENAAASADGESESSAGSKSAAKTSRKKAE